MSKVEIWAIPTGTGITPDDYTLLGSAKRQNAAGQNDVWSCPIPSKTISVTETFAKGFDARENMVGTKFLPHECASEIDDALWADAKQQVPSHGESSLWFANNPYGIKACRFNFLQAPLRRAMLVCVGKAETANKVRESDRNAAYA